jgi:hypothetical protein
LDHAATLANLASENRGFVTPDTSILVQENSHLNIMEKLAEACLVRAETTQSTELPRPGTVGIVRECYSKWERRAPLTPSNVAHLVKV